MTALVGGECARCGHVAFPRLLLCPRCGGGDWRDRLLDGGTVEEATVVRRMPGLDPAEPVRLGTVRADAGPVLLARLEAGVEAGDRIELRDDAGAPVAGMSQTSGR